MPPKNKIDYDIAIKMFKNKKTAKEIAKIFNVWPASIRQGLKRRGYIFENNSYINLRSKTNTIYVAGLFDGEGSININKKGRYFWLTVDIGTTSENLCNWLLNNVGGHIRISTKKNLKHKTGYHWTLCSKQAKNFLLLIKPYLIIKKQEALIGIKFQKQMISISNKLTIRDIKKREKLKQQLENLR